MPEHPGGDDPPALSADGKDGHGQETGRLSLSRRRPRPRADMGARFADHVWFEVDIVPGEWRAAYRLVMQDGHLVIAEVRVMPIEPPRPARRAGEWSTAPGAVPLRGLTQETLRRLRTDEPMREARERLDSFAEQGFDDDDFPGFQALAVGNLSSSRRGRRLELGQVAEVAGAYCRHAAADAPAPIRATADELGYSEGHVRKRIALARERGIIIDSPGPGRAGGTLSDSARELLSQ